MMLHHRLRAASGARGGGAPSGADFFDPMDGTGWVGLNSKIVATTSPFSADGIRATNGIAEYTAYKNHGFGTSITRWEFDFLIYQRDNDDIPFFDLSSDTIQSAGDIIFTPARQIATDSQRRPYLIAGSTLTLPVLPINTELHATLTFSGGSGTLRINSVDLSYDESGVFSYTDAIRNYMLIFTQHTEGSTGSVIYDNVEIWN